ncbi:hypothetical protein ACJX0J_031878, partial [Zea mays]
MPISIFYYKKIYYKFIGQCSRIYYYYFEVARSICALLLRPFFFIYYVLTFFLGLLDSVKTFLLADIFFPSTGAGFSE